jgi:hypothetical protein
MVLMPLDLPMLPLVAVLMGNPMGEESAWIVA